MLRKKICALALMSSLVPTTGFAGLMAYEEIVFNRETTRGPIKSVVINFDGTLGDITKAREQLGLRYGDQPVDSWLNYNATLFPYWADANISYLSNFVDPKCLVFSVVVKHLVAGHQVFISSLRKAPMEPILYSRTDESITNYIVNSLLNQARELNMELLLDAIRNLTIQFVSSEQLLKLLSDTDIFYSDQDKDKNLIASMVQGQRPQFVRVLHTEAENGILSQKIDSDEWVLRESDTSSTTSTSSTSLPIVSTTAASDAVAKYPWIISITIPSVIVGSIVLGVTAILVRKYEIWRKASRYLGKVAFESIEMTSK